MLDFKNLKQIMSKLSDAKIARQHMEEMRWEVSHFAPHCSSTTPYKLKDGKTDRCKTRSVKRILQ